MLRARQDATDPADNEPEEDFTAYIRNIYKRRRRLSRTAIVFIAIGVLGFLLAADAIFTIRRLETALEEMAASMRAGQAAVVEGHLERAESEFITAQDRAGEARELAKRPSLVLAAYVPVVGNDAAVLRKLPEAADEVAGGGRSAIDAARAVGATSKADFARSLFRNGRVSFATLDIGGRYVGEALAHFRRAEAILADLPQPTFSRLRTALASASSQIDAVRGVVERGNLLLEVLPDMMGREAPRRYLVAFQSPSEARATGGLFGLYGVLETVNGRSALLRVGPWALIEQRAQAGGRNISELEALLAAQAEEGTSAFGFSPSFEEFGRRVLRVYRQATGTRLDGVLAVDPIALGHLSAATGPLKGEGIDQPIGPDNATDVILRDSYIRFARDPLGQALFLQTLIQDFWDTLGSGRVDAAALINAFGQAGRGKHLKIFSVDPDEQAVLSEFGMDGNFASSGESVQFVFHNNLARNKIDYYLHRDLDMRVRITRDDYALVTTKITLDNKAPRTLPEGLGSQNYNAGVNKMDLGVVLPRDAIFGGLRVDGRVAQARLAASTTTPSYPIVLRKITIPPKETATITVSYRIPEATELLRGGEFKLTLFPHATVRPDEFSVTIQPPAGFHIVPQGSGESEPDGDVHFQGVLAEEFRILVNVIPI